MCSQSSWIICKTASNTSERVSRLARRHALVGCASAVASRGKCGAGALSGAAGSFAGPFLVGLDFQAKLVASSVIGGLASVAGGGKFANGAVTAAFGYLFNEGGGEPASREPPKGTPIWPYDDPYVPFNELPESAWQRRRTTLSSSLTPYFKFRHVRGKSQ
jgi:hypothetical protein